MGCTLHADRHREQSLLDYRDLIWDNWDMLCSAFQKHKILISSSLGGW
jgi:hypothetical protein